MSRAIPVPRVLKLQGIAAVALVLAACLPTTGCSPASQANAKTVVAKIAQYIPEMTVAGDTVAAVIATLQPQDALAIKDGQAIFDTAQQQLAALCASYLATPNAGTLLSLSAVMTTLLNTNAAQLLAAAKISDPASVAQAQIALGAARTLLLLVDGLVQQISTPAANAAAAQARTMKLSQAAPFLDRRRIERETGHSFASVQRYETSLGF